MATEEPDRPLHVLVAEDVPEIRLMAIAILRRRGHRTTEAGTGREAVEAVAAEPPDVVLMDIQMPDMDGIEATRAIRAAEGDRRRTPILAFTAGGPEAQPEACLEAGMDAFLRKPLNPPVLLETVERYGRGQAAVVEPGGELPPGLLEVAEGDPDLLARMAEVFLEFAPVQVRRLRKAQEEEDSGAMAEIARELRGGAKAFRADGILIPTERLEFLASRGIFDLTRPLVDLIAREVEALERRLGRIGGTGEGG